jgi:hypothetical protein
MFKIQPETGFFKVCGLILDYNCVSSNASLEIKIIIKEFLKCINFYFNKRLVFY